MAIRFISPSSNVFKGFSVSKNYIFIYIVVYFKTVKLLNECMNKRSKGSTFCWCVTHSFTAAFHKNREKSPRNYFMWDMHEQ